MEEHRLVDTDNITALSFVPPFSCFEYVDKHYGKENRAIRRLFSLARSHSARTVMIEKIEPVGIISDENDEIRHYVTDYKMGDLHRVSFWRSSFKVPDVSVCRKQNCIGYAILKHDKALSKNYNEWHVFEAVFRKYPHKHNCVPSPMKYRVNLGGVPVLLNGLLYAQQNKLNKTCAQVALRSVISRIIRRDVSYRQINDIAQNVSMPVPIQAFNPADGLATVQIRAVLEGFGIEFRDFDYTQYGRRAKYERKRHPYQKFVYSGVESGAGALVAFRFIGPAIQEDRCHMIPFYGHTFNKDTWAPEADIAYFHVGEDLKYVSSENWTSSFLGHDDNFGPNFCVPRLYIPPESVEYIVELLRPGFVFDGLQAEALALQFLYSVLRQNVQSANAWLERLTYYYDIQMVVLRAVAISRSEYIRHLSNEKDWSQNSEDREIINILGKYLPKALWAVEISIPQLFPANERKLGEIVLSGEISIGQKLSPFLFARLPSRYFFESPDKRKKQDFLTIPSNLVSHTKVIRLK